MSVEIRFELTPEAQRTALLFRRFPDFLLRAIQRGMNLANNDLMRRVLRSRFTGAGPFAVSEHRLGERTRHLHDSMRATDAAIKGNTVTSAIGSPLPYFRAHEFGFNGQQSVRAHQRTMTIRRFDGRRSSAVAIKEKGAFTKAGKLRKAFEGRVTEETRQVSVRAFTRWMQIPERAPMRTGIEENLSRYGETVSKTILADLGEYA